VTSGADASPAAPRLTLVVTTFREADVLAGSLPRIAAALRALPDGAELLFVDDGSGDGTAEWLRARLPELADLSPRLFVHETNRGRGAALVTGFTAARGRNVGYLDLDLEVPETHLAACVDALDAGADVAIACRRYVATKPGFDLRTFLSLGYRRLTRLVLRHPVKDTEAGYKFFRRASLLRLLPHVREGGWFFDTEIVMLAWLASMRIAEVDVEFRRRSDKVSTVRVARDVRRYLVALLAFAGRRGAVARRLRAGTTA
jgi:glycosyltransferase involved in cell wall biosynthesis